MTVQVPAIPTPVPQTTDPTNFDARADAFLASLPAVVTAQNLQNVENNTLNTNINARSVLTAEDRVQTGLDRAAAALSKTGTAEDRVQTGLDRAAATANSANVTIVAGIADNVTAVAGNAANVSSVAGINTAVSTVAGIAASVTAVNANANNVNAVAGNAANINAANGNAATTVTKAAEALASQILSTNSANLAASNTRSQLDAIRTQTETARDQAIAGLGAADNSQNLSLLLAGLQQALDLAGQAADWPINVARGEALLAGISAALDLAGVTAKQVNGGQVQLAAGSLTEPSLWGPADRNTGVFFPTADAMELVAAGLMRLHADAIGVGIGTNTPSGLLDVNDNRVRIRTAKTPASATAAGSTGEVCWDAGFVYVCTATNVWRRTALATW